jgi:hypothetical protein
MTGDVSVSIGIQRITFHKNGIVGHVTVIANPEAAYVRGDAFTLATYMGFSAPQAAKYADRWIIIPKAAQAYPEVARDVMLGTVIADLRPPTPTALAPATSIGGSNVVAVRGTTRKKGEPDVVVTLYAAATGALLPRQEVVTAGKARVTQILSRWNEPVHVTIPTGATPVSSTTTI